MRGGMLGPTMRAPAFENFPAEVPVWVVCLCADWCGLCRDYEALFRGMARRHPSWRFTWIDIEDESELVGELDVETFPTLLLATTTQTLFIGPLTPQIEALTRLLDSAREGRLPPAAHSAEVAALLRSLKIRYLPVEAVPDHQATAKGA